MYYCIFFILLIYTLITLVTFLVIVSNHKLCLLVLMVIHSYPLDLLLKRIKNYIICYNNIKLVTTGNFKTL